MIRRKALIDVVDASKYHSDLRLFFDDISPEPLQNLV